MSRGPDNPPPQYALTDAARAINQIRQLRHDAHDPDLDALPVAIVDDLDVQGAVAYVEQRRDVSPSTRAAELPHRALLVEYLRQRAHAEHERRLLSVLQTGFQLGARPAAYGAPMGIPSRQALYDRRTRLARKRAEDDDRKVDEGRARRWLDDHAAQIHEIAEFLVDHRDDLADLAPSRPAREELVTCIDDAGRLMSSRRVSQDLCTAVALAVHLLRSGADSRTDGDTREIIERGWRLLW